MKPQLHATALGMKCPEAFRRRYLEGEIIPPGVAMLVGIATDKSVSKNLDNKIKTSSLLSEAEIADTARDGLNLAWESGVTLQPEEIADGIKKIKGDATDKAVRLSVLHAKKKAPEIEPTHIQRKWAIELPGYPLDLVGTLDIQEGALSVRDTKTAGKSPSDNAAENSVQLKAYSLAVKVLDGKAPEKVKLDYLIDNKTPIVKTVEASCGEDDYQALLARVEVWSRAIEKGVFIPVEPDHWACSPKFCGYALTCRYYVNKPKQFAV